MGFVPQSFTLTMFHHRIFGDPGFIAAIFRQWKIHRSMELNGWFSIAMLPSMGCRTVTCHCATLLHPTDHLDVARCQVRPDSWRHAQQKTLRVQPPECAAGQLCAKFSSRDWTRMTTVPWQKRRCPTGNSWGIQEVFHNHKNRNQFAKGSPRASKVWIARSRNQTHQCSMHLLMVDRSVRPSAITGGLGEAHGSALTRHIFLHDDSCVGKRRMENSRPLGNFTIFFSFPYSWNAAVYDI